MRHLGSCCLLAFAALHAACSADPGAKSTISATGGSSATGGAGGGAGSAAQAGSIGLGPIPMGGDMNAGGSGGSGAPPIVWPPPTPAWTMEADGGLAYEDPSASGAGTKFGTRSANPGPALEYPLTGSLHPANLGKITFQWSGSGSSLFRIQAKTQDGKVFHLYASCAAASGPCEYSPPPEFWVDIGVQSGAMPVQVTLAGTSTAGGTFDEGSPITVQFTKEPLPGAVYFWSTQTEAVMRASMDSAEPAVPFIAPNSDTNKFGCTGCHSVSRNGKVISFNVAVEPSNATNTAVQTASVEDPTHKFIEPSGSGAPSDHFGYLPALDPKGDFVVYASAPMQDFELANAQTGEVLQHIHQGDALFGGGTNIAAHPEWSPDGKLLAVALSNRKSGDCSPDLFMVCDAGIATMPFDGSALGSAKLVAHSATDYLFYPTWSPDGKYLAFARHTMDGSHSNSKMVPVTLSMVPVDGEDHACPGPTCYDFPLGGQHGDASWPKFTPFAVDGGRYLFMSLSSRSPYGHKALGRSMLWMFGLDLTKLGADDASFAPVWLPQQILPTVGPGNLQAIWTQKLPCNGDGGEEACKGCVAGRERCVITPTECSCVAVPPK